jgi:UDP-N-acetylglucosamine--N-acetylmuramyl-(pentapeptide) pyrophosphoryl-undecaprenol N-acetylglucosamine transferase
MSRFAIAAGGTGGHLFPGLAVAEILHARWHEVMLLTSEKQIDAVATEGRSEFRIERLPGMGLPRGFSLSTFRFLFRFNCLVGKKFGNVHGAFLLDVDAYH